LLQNFLILFKATVVLLFNSVKEQALNKFYIFTIGYTDETAKQKIRKPLEEIVHWNSFRSTKIP